MTKEEIKALIAERIAGQGDQVDIGGALAEVLDEIVDLAGEGGGGSGSVLKMETDLSTLTSGVALSYATKAEFAEAVGCDESLVDGLFDAEFPSFFIYFQNMWRGVLADRILYRKDGETLDVIVNLGGADEFTFTRNLGAHPFYGFEHRVLAG